MFKFYVIFALNFMKRGNSSFMKINAKNIDVYFQFLLLKIKLLPTTLFKI